MDRLTLAGNSFHQDAKLPIYLEDVGLAGSARCCGLDTEFDALSTS